MNYYAVDPGIAAAGGSGWALFLAGTLVAAGVLRNHKSWRTLSQRVAGQAESFAAVRAVHGLHPAVAEQMRQLYKVPANDLLDVQTVSGKLGDVWVPPSVWKGSLPRDIEINRSWAALSPAERLVVDAARASTIKSLHKEITSAVGIGLSVAGRAHRRCGWPN